MLGITVPARARRAAVCRSSVLAEVIRTIAAVDPAIAQVPQAHFLFVDVLAVWGSEPGSGRLFADVLHGARLGNGLAERGGLHAQDLKTRLRGQPPATAASTTAPARSRPAGSGSARWTRTASSCSPSSTGTPGVKVDDDWDVMGQRATVSGTATFDDVAVDPELIVPYERAFQVPQQLGARAQLLHAAIQVGSRKGRCAMPATFVRTKAPAVLRGRPGRMGAPGRRRPAHHLPVRRARDPRARRAGAARLGGETLDEVTRRPLDADEAARGSLAVAQAKAFASEVAVQVASDMFALTGASAADERHDLSRHWRNARTHASHDPSTGSTITWAIT